MPEKLRLALASPKLVDLRFKEGVKIDHLHRAIDRIVNLAGCPQCGLNGIDIRLGEVIDVADRLQIEHLASAELVPGR